MCYVCRVTSCHHVVMKLVVIMFVMTITSLKVLKTFVHGKMFNCKMTEEPTMATAEEAAQRVYAKKLAADRESKKRKRAEESQEKQENRLAADRESKKRKRAEESQEQRENSLAASRDYARLGMCNFRQRRRVEELPEQRETRLAAKRESEKRRRAEESQE